MSRLSGRLLRGLLLFPSWSGSASVASRPVGLVLEDRLIEVVVKTAQVHPRHRTVLVLPVQRPERAGLGCRPGST
ncbi:MAG: hypothetical protein AAF220_14290, partial [Pseudomonadota bacterium]